jgi:hypothetical protein
VNNKGQISFTWALIGATVALIVITFFWMTLDQASKDFLTIFVGIGANSENLTIIESIWNFTPIMLLISWGIYLLTIASIR